MQVAIAAGIDNIKLSKGQMTLDDTRINFNARLAEFSRPDIAFEADLDRINIDRYLPPKTEKKSAPATPAATGSHCHRHGRIVGLNSVQDCF